MNKLAGVAASILVLALVLVTAEQILGAMNLREARLCISDYTSRHEKCLAGADTYSAFEGCKEAGHRAVAFCYDDAHKYEWYWNYDPRTRRVP